MPVVSKEFKVSSSEGEVTVDLETGKWYIGGKEYLPPNYSLELASSLNESRED